MNEKLTRPCGAMGTCSNYHYFIEKRNKEKVTF